MSNPFKPIDTRPIPCPENGIYKNMPAEEYHQIDAANASTLKKFYQSGQHGAHAMRKAMEPNGALYFGQALHMAMLEPAELNERMMVRSDIGPSAEVAHRKALQEWRDDPQNEGKPDPVILRKGWAGMIHDMNASAQACPAARRLMDPTLDADNEITYIWRMPIEIDGRKIMVPCKARADRFIRDFVPYKDAPPCNGIVDIKSTTSVDPHKFERSIADFWYHGQGAWYLLGASANGELSALHDWSYQIIAMEKNAPNPVAVYPINAAALGYGLHQCKTALRRYVAYRLLDHAPGPHPEAMPMGLPPYAQPSEQEIIDNNL